jgi:hypothetical protein
MPNDPFTTRPPITDPETVAAWRTYERTSSAAADQYAAMPSAYCHAQFDDLAVVRTCLHCPRKTRSSDGQCPRCKKAVVGR